MAYRSKLRSCDRSNILKKLYDEDNFISSDSDTNCNENESEEESACSYKSNFGSTENDFQNSKAKLLTRKNPTRRPDPNVCNRNALLARENRRRKKDYLEKLENDIKNCENNNKQLSKIMKKQTKLINKLQYERNYYRNILVNKKKLFELVNVVKNSKIMHQKEPETENTNYPTNASLNSFDGDYGSALSEDPFLSSALMDKCNNIFTDYKSFNDGDEDEQWNFLGNISPLSLKIENMDSSSSSDLGFDSNSTLPDTLIESNISNEHNYFTVNNNFVQKQNSQDAAAVDLGICLHVTQNGFSFEMCPDCHQSFMNNKMPTEEENMPDVLL